MIFVPEWADEKESKESNNESTGIDCPWIKRLANSRWKRKQVTVSAFEHEFRHAAQHLLPK